MDKSVIFLDIDGVLNSKKTKYKHGNALGLDAINLENLRNLVNACQAEIVLISGWKEEWDKIEKDNPRRHSHYGKYIDWKFAKHGLSIADKINGNGYHMRSYGIREYIRKHNVDFFLILDDEEDPEYYRPDMFCYWIQPFSSKGLTEADVKRAISIKNETSRIKKESENAKNEEQSIKFVMGPACSGKSTFIKNTFPKHTVIDLYDFQIDYLKSKRANIQNIMQSYEDAKTALIEAIKKGENVILEHTLLLQKRRPMYIDAVRSVTSAPIDIFVMKPTLKTFKKLRKMRGCSGDLKGELDLMEIPTQDEGFRYIYIIEPKVD